MFKLQTLGVVSVVLLSAGTVWADLVAEPMPPPKEKVLTGKLDWEKVKKRDGTTVRGRLLLTTGDRQVALPVTAGGKVKATRAGSTIDVGDLVGKQVKVTAKVIEPPRRKSTTRILSVTRIVEASPRAARPTARNGRQLANTRSR